MIIISNYHILHSILYVLFSICIMGRWPEVLNKIFVIVIVIVIDFIDINVSVEIDEYPSLLFKILRKKQITRLTF